MGGVISSTGFVHIAPQGGSAGMGSMGTNPSANPGGASAAQINLLENQVTHLTALLGKLQTDLGDLWREKGEDIVKINGRTFTGLADWRSYYAAECPSGNPTSDPFHIHFVDFISLLVRAAGSDLSILEELSLDQKSKQVFKEPGSAAVHRKSYDLVLPPQFGKSLSAKSTESESTTKYTDYRLLPMFKTFDDFAGEHRSTSAIYHILRKVKDAQEVLINGLDCHGTLGLLAMVLINAAQNFAERLFQWMATMYREKVKEKGEESSKEVWKFISHSFSEICRELYSIRKFGSRSDPVGQIWYALRAWKLQQRLLENAFSKDKIVTGVLHQHIQEDAVSKSIYEKEKKQMETEIAAIRKLVQQANSRKNGKNNSEG